MTVNPIVSASRGLLKPVERQSLALRYWSPVAVAVWLLAWMAGWMVYEARRENATMDEAPHIPAGYSYIVKKDMRLNPEHPPLVKDLAGLGISALVRDVNFPDDLPSWRDNVNDQWSFGFDFLYRSGNDADRMVFAARLPAILLTLGLGALIYVWASGYFGRNWALLPLALFAFSPNFTAHGKLVTTDIGATFGVMLALFAFSKYLAKPDRKRFWFAGAALGIGLLMKFTVVLIVPVLALLAVIKAAREKQWLLRLAAVGAVAVAIVWLGYAWHVWNYPPQRQLADAEHNLATYAVKPLKDLNLWMDRQAVFRPLGQYMTGLLMNMQRGAGGNTTYFMGEVSNRGWRSYFPIVYHLKEPIPVLILIYAGAVLGIAAFIKRRRSFREWDLGMVGMAVFIVFYWAISVLSPLNIGLRHVFPTIPLIYILATGPVVRALSGRNIFGWTAFGLVMLWVIVEHALWAPWHLAYFNQIAGGPAGGYRYVTDSNLDWGQSLKELRDFVVKNDIEKIKVDYFGGGDPRYYLGDRFEPMYADLGPQKGWLAVSATFLQGERGEPVPGFPGDCCRYRWLDAYAPVAQIGYSIFVYRID